MPDSLLTQDLNEIFRKHLATVIIGVCVVVGVVVGTAVTWYWMTSLDLSRQAQANEERSISTKQALDSHVTESLQIQRENRAINNQILSTLTAVQSDLAVVKDRTE